MWVGRVRTDDGCEVFLCESLTRTVRLSPRVHGLNGLDNFAAGETGGVGAGAAQTMRPDQSSRLR